MDNLSKVIFTCLAIGYTFLIYQNNELNNEIQSIKDSEVMQLKDLWKIEESYKIALDNQLRIDETILNTSNDFLKLNEMGMDRFNLSIKQYEDNKRRINNLSNELYITRDELNKVVKYLNNL